MPSISPSPLAAVPLIRTADSSSAWLAASVTLTGRLIVERERAPLDVIVETALAISGVEVVLVAVPAGDRWAVAAAGGANAEHLQGREHVFDGTPIGEVLLTGGAVTTRTPVLGTDRDEPEFAAFPQGPCMVVPLRGPEGVVGAFAYCRAAGQPRFRFEDLGPAAIFAGHATAALGGSAEVSPASTVQDFSDDLIQNIFASGVAIESVVAELDGDRAQRLIRAVRTLDDVIARLRATIHAQATPARGTGS